MFAPPHTSATLSGDASSAADRNCLRPRRCPTTWSRPSSRSAPDSSLALSRSLGSGSTRSSTVSSGLIILWQFRHRLPEFREQQALGLMAVSFFALAAYVTFESLRSLLGGHQPDPSPVGIGLAIASLTIMPFLPWAQRRTGKSLGSNTVVADSTQTLLCTYLSVVLLAGFLLNATLGWAWADPLAGLVIAAVAVREGLEAWRGEGCACGPAVPGSLAASRPADIAGDVSCGPGDGCCSNDRSNHDRNMIEEHRPES